MIGISSGMYSWRPCGKERMLQALMGKPALQQASLERFIMSLDEVGLKRENGSWRLCKAYFCFF